MLVSSRSLYFATSNKHKFNEAKDVLKDYNFKLKIIKSKFEEIQSDDLRKIALHALSKALIIDKSPMIVEDAGLFINALNGFPGPYSSYVHRTLGIDGIIKLMSSKDDREAEFRSVVAFSDFSITKTFQGVVRGMISIQPRGKSGFGFDPIFIPKGLEKTFAEMSLEDKNRYSHRAIALKKFATWYMKFINKSKMN
ncbi:MAG: XTP/dITP diphosphatase [archaeon]|nr:XTP/dITP diphosphatase [archaeon]MCP8321040.1 XTP/dITP diphosphatase [archaeon]